MYNVGGQIGGDAELSPRGQEYAKALPGLILDNVGDAPLTVSANFFLLDSRLDLTCLPLPSRFGRRP